MEILRLEENNKGSISANVFQVDSLFKNENVVKTKSPKVRDAKLHIDVLNVQPLWW